MRKRIWSLCMVLVLCLGLLPYMTVPASAAESQIIVGGVTLTGSGESPAYATTNTAGTVTTADASESNYNIKWDGSTLILNGATIIGSFSDPAISCAGSLTITLVESNTVTSERTSCIHTDGNLTINGSGQLSAAIDSIKSGFDNAEYYGIYVGGSLTITSGTVTVTGGHLTGYGQLKSYGIYASNDMTVSGGAVTATGGSVDLWAPSAYSYGIYVNGTTNVTGGTVTAIGGTVTSQYTYAYSYGLYVGALDLSGGTITAMSGTATAAVASSGHGAVISSGFTISGGTFTAIGTKSGYKTNMFIHYNPPQGCTFYQIIGGNNGRTYTQMTISSSSEGNLPQDRPFTRIITVRNDIDPVITEITVTPSSSTIQAGDELQFSADVTGINGANEAINWSVSGNQQQGTTISPAGLLTVDVNETAPNLTVTATSAQDGITFASVAVSVTAAAHIHEGVLVPSVAATCTEPGSKAYYVCSCNKYFEDEECSKEITELDTWKVIPASGHQWSDTYLAEHADAEKHYHVCEICGEKDEGQAHTYGDDQTCDVCGYLRECIITFDANEGSVDTTSVKTENGKLPNLPTPTRKGYDFTGWYTAKDGGELVTTDTVFYADTTLYARWRVKTPPVITVNISPAEGGSCLVAEITSDMDDVEDLTQLNPKPLVNGTYTAKESGSAIILFPQAAPGYMIDTADYDKLPGEDENTVSFDGPEDFSYISITTERDLTVNLTFREASNLTVGDATLSNGPVCYATTDGSGHVTPQPDYTENDSWNIKWDSANSTLTLRNASIQGIVDGNGSSCGIFYEASLSIVLEGTNQVTSADVDTANGEAMSTGIYGKGKLSFSGSGSLTAAAGESASSVGIAAEGALTFGDRVNVDASGADVSVTGDVDVSSIKWGGQSTGVFSSASITVQGEADVTATGGHYQVSESGKTNIGFSTGCQSIQVSVQGGKLTAAAQESTNDWFGIEAYTVTASGGEIIASGNPVFYWENSEEEDLRCIFTVVPPAGKLYRVEAGNGGSLAEIAGSPFTAETALDSSLFQSDTTFHCYLADDPTHQHTYDQWKYDETNHWHACACGASADDAAPHVYDSDADLTCDVCGYERTIATYSVSVSASPAEGGSVTGSGTYAPGTSVQLTATANSGYHFVKWKVLSGNITINSSNAFTMPAEAVEVQAVFAQDSSGGSSGGGSSSAPIYSISLPDHMTGGEIKPSPRYAEEGNTVTLTVTPDEGYVLDTLTVTDNKGKVITLTNKGNGKYTFTMPGSRVTVDAVFVKSPETLPFTDVSESYWAYDEIVWAWENGYMSGTAATSFNPGGTVSRQQVWMILARMAGENPANMAEAKAWAVASGISDGSNPGGAVTRQQLAALLYRYAVQYGYDVSVGEDTNILSYTDFADLSEYAIPAMQWACGAGIINGTGDGSTLSPQGVSTRAQLAVMLYRWLA